jgi:hypothetical protein
MVHIFSIVPLLHHVLHLLVRYSPPIDLPLLLPLPLHQLYNHRFLHHSRDLLSIIPLHKPIYVHDRRPKAHLQNISLLLLVLPTLATATAKESAKGKENESVSGRGRENHLRHVPLLRLRNHLLLRLNPLRILSKVPLVPLLVLLPSNLFNRSKRSILHRKNGGR